MADTNEVLLGKIKRAVAEHNAAERAHEATYAHLVSKSKEVGTLLLEAKKRHPKVADFETFLSRVNGLKLSRAYDLLRLAGGRTTDEEIRKDQRERKQKSRAKKKANTKSPLSVTDPHVTESQEVGTDQRRAENAALDTEPTTDDLPIPSFLDRTGGEAAKADRASEYALAQFLIACQTWLPKLTLAKHRQHACDVVATLCCEQCREAA